MVPPGAEIAISVSPQPCVCVRERDRREQRRIHFQRVPQPLRCLRTDKRVCV